MNSFFQDRGLWPATVVLIMFAISLAQGSISYTMAFGALRILSTEGRFADCNNSDCLAVWSRCSANSVVDPQTQASLLRMVTIANTLFTWALLVHTHALVAVLLGSIANSHPYFDGRRHADHGVERADLFNMVLDH